MVEFKDYYDAVKNEVERILKEKEVYFGAIDIAAISNTVLKELIMADLGASVKRVGSDVEHGIPGKLVISLPTSKESITIAKWLTYLKNNIQLKGGQNDIIT